MSGRVTLIATVVGLLLPVVAAATVRPPGPDPAAAEAEGLVARAIKLRKQGRDAAALPLLEKAHELAPSARTAAQLGTCEQALARWGEAEQHLAVALAAHGDPYLESNRPAIEDSYRAVVAHLGRLVVALSFPPGRPAQADITVDGNRVPPEGRYLLPGKYKIAIAAACCVDPGREAVVHAGRVTPEMIKLELRPEVAAQIEAERAEQARLRAEHEAAIARSRADSERAIAEAQRQSEVARRQAEQQMATALKSSTQAAEDQKTRARRLGRKLGIGIWGGLGLTFGGVGTIYMFDDSIQSRENGWLFAGSFVAAGAVMLSLGVYNLVQLIRDK